MSSANFLHSLCCLLTSPNLVAVMIFHQSIRSCILPNIVELENQIDHRINWEFVYKYPPQGIVLTSKFKYTCFHQAIYFLEHIFETPAQDEDVN